MTEQEATRVNPGLTLLLVRAFKRLKDLLELSFLLLD